MEIGVIRIDGAYVVPDSKMKTTDDEVEIEFIINHEYKYLSAFPIFEDGGYAPVASKDLKSWVICYGAILDGNPLPLLDVVDQLRHQCE